MKENLNVLWQRFLKSKERAEHFNNSVMFVEMASDYVLYYMRGGKRALKFHQPIKSYIDIMYTLVRAYGLAKNFGKFDVADQCAGWFNTLASKLGAGRLSFFAVDQNNVLMLRVSDSMSTMVLDFRLESGKDEVNHLRNVVIINECVRKILENGVGVVDYSTVLLLNDFYRYAFEKYEKL
jgi:hypothetical protein